MSVSPVGNLNTLTKTSVFPLLILTGENRRLPSAGGFSVPVVSPRRNVTGLKASIDQRFSLAKVQASIFAQCFLIRQSDKEETGSSRVQHSRLPVSPGTLQGARREKKGQPESPDFPIKVLARKR